MGLREDLKRFEEVGEEKRQDLSEFIQHGQIQAGDDIQIPIKVIELPSFEYDQRDMGGVGQGDGDVGDPVDQPGEEGEEGEAGEETGEHGYYEMDPEEFAKELDEELGLDLEPKGKKIKEKKEGPLVELARSGPDSTLDFERMYKKGLKRSLSMFFDEDYMREVMKVEGFGVQKTFEWARSENIPVSRSWIETEYENLNPEEKTVYSSVDDIEKDFQKTPTAKDIESVALRDEDKRHKYPEITREYEKNAVVVFIRDVSGSMRDEKRRLVERVFTPIDWYLTGKYDNAEFVYIAHDSEAWEVERDDFFGIRSGGGTKISTAYELAEDRLDTDYPWSEWNRYVFASGDGENWQDDSEEKVVPLMKSIDANLHSYVEVQPDEGLSLSSGHHKGIVDDNFTGRDNVATYEVNSEDDVMDCIYELLSTEDSEQ